MWIQVSQSLERLDIVLADIAGRQTAVLAALAHCARSGEGLTGMRVRARGHSLRLELPRRTVPLDAELVIALARAARRNAAGAVP